MVQLASKCTYFLVAVQVRAPAAAPQEMHAITTPEFGEVNVQSSILIFFGREENALTSQLVSDHMGSQIAQDAKYVAWL